MREYLTVFLVAAAVTYLLGVVAREVALRTGAVAKVRDRDEHGNVVTIPNPYNVVISVMMLKEGWDVRNVKVIVPLGQIAFAKTVRSLKARGAEIPSLTFGHGKVYSLSNGLTLIVSYHPSQRNTQTGLLTPRMFDRVFARARQALGTPHLPIKTHSGRMG